MRLKQIKLYNIRSYIQEVVDFPSGSTLLWGNIGSGKSTVLLALDFVLFGLQRSNLTGASLLRNGKESGYVQLECKIDNKEITLLRTLKRTKSGVVQDAGFIVKDGVKEEKTAIELKQQVLELLNYPKDLLTKNKSLIYRYTVYTPQEEMKSILLGPKEERLDTLRRVFGVDKYKRIRDNAKILATKLRELKRTYQGMAHDLPEKELMLKGKQDELNIIINKTLSIQPLVQMFKEEYNSKKESLNQIQTQKEKRQEVKKTLAQKQIELKHILENKSLDSKRVEKLTEEIKQIELEIKDVDQEVITIIELKEKDLKEELARQNKNLLELNSLKENLNFLEKNLPRLIDSSIKLNEKLNQLEKEISDLNKFIIPDNKKGEELEAKKQKYELKQKELRITLNQLQELKTKRDHLKHLTESVKNLVKCSGCFQEVKEEYKEKFRLENQVKIESLNKSKDSKEEEAKKIEKDIFNLKAEIEELREWQSRTQISKLKKKDQDLKRSEFTDVNNELNLIENRKRDTNQEILILQDKTDKLKERKELISKSVKLLNEELEELRPKQRKVEEIRIRKLQIENKKKDLLEAVTRLQSMKTKIGEVNQYILSLQEELGLSEGLEQVYKLEEDALQQIEIKLREKEKEYHGLEINKKLQEERIVELEKEIQKKIKVVRKKEKTNKNLFWITDYFIPLMDTMEKNILFKVHADFNNLFEKWFDILINNEDLKMSLDVDYSPKILQNGYDIDYAYLSGGEKTAGALAYRLALNQVINSLNAGIKTSDLLILDEPTDGFSQEQLENLKSLMEEINIPQVIIVSHKPEIEAFVQNIVRIEKNQHVSQIMRPE